MSGSGSDSDELEAPDYRLLSKSSYSLPSRGDKDFEPDGTRKQDATLLASRQALYAAVAVQRVLPADCMMCAWNPCMGHGILLHPKGPLFKSMGRSFGANKACMLLPEETLFLLERGSLVLHLQDDTEQLPLSVQAAYALCLDKDVSLAQYQVYSHLKRAGFHVLRATQVKHDIPSFLTTLQDSMRRVSRTLTQLQSGCVDARSVYRSYTQLYNRLAMSPCHDPREQINTTTPSRLHVCYDVWKPGVHFKKSMPGEPHFRVCVCTTDDAMPLRAEMDALLASIPLHTQTPTLRDGYRESLILAIVDAGVMSLLRLGDISFSTHKRSSQSR
ncbi:hypothetical protein BCR37DRAFT_37092 [Protomyces lactucae-debilis]|uniref:tRNA-splicing endonuclease subunit Sen54 N-terminal domain-containing protein n=1 Tax=Protomyces lactucae-debilis TaxID=2754530 RepID=A0A1Y2FDV8_PROLT|nr:uncharacterized protein BCR37DRAFT_37092 [Protomyces lactucae-debilis]ORY82110.1 hypothetical protein BCR37DRAFT_37092 [Protomyces lactucae-debilis]